MVVKTHYVFLSDENYLPGLRVAVWSLRRFVQDSPITVYTTAEAVREDEILRRCGCSFVSIPEASEYGEAFYAGRIFTPVVSQKVAMFSESFGADYVVFTDSDTITLRDPLPLVERMTQHPGKIGARSCPRLKQADYDFHAGAGHLIIPSEYCGSEVFSGLVSYLAKDTNRWEEQAISRYFQGRFYALGEVAVFAEIAWGGDTPVPHRGGDILSPMNEVLRVSPTSCGLEVRDPRPAFWMHYHESLKPWKGARSIHPFWAATERAMYADMGLAVPADVLEEPPFSGCRHCGFRKKNRRTFYARANAFRAAIWRWIKAGRPVRSAEEIQQIFRTCLYCDSFLPNRSLTAGECAECGCRIASTVSMLPNKAAMTTEHCPLEKWK